MQCPACGDQNKHDARFCANCGALLIDDTASLRPGQAMDGGRYRIVRALGKGGMGAVYLAANTRAFDRLCVVKEVIEYYDPTNSDERRKALERFEIEARTLAALKHPGIPDIYAYFTEQGRNFLVMEYIDGPNLAEGLTRERDGQVVQGSPQPVEKVLRQAIELAEVLDFLSQRQPPVMHNDIKPANVILDKNSGRAVLVDFGTAKTRYARQGKGRPGSAQSSVYGTVGYAAPELYDGKGEPRSDVHALAVMTYHLLTDDDPRAHPFRYPKMDTIPAALPPVLVQAMDADLAKRPSAAEFGRQLAQVLRELTGEKGGSATPDAQAGSQPRLKVLSHDLQVDLGTDGDRSVGIRLTNVGGGHFDGKVVSSVPWLQVEERVSCAPGEMQSLSVTIDPSGLSPAQEYTAEVKVQASGHDVARIPIVVRVPPREVEVVPPKVVLGEAAANPAYMLPKSVQIRNNGVLPVECSLTTSADWLIFALIDAPRGGTQDRFAIQPGEKQDVEISGRWDLVPESKGSLNQVLRVDVIGGETSWVPVLLRPQDKAQRGNSRLVRAVMIGIASAALLGAVIWFVSTALPLLLP